LESEEFRAEIKAELETMKQDAEADAKQKPEAYAE
jgi:hypothetical protein